MEVKTPVRRERRGGAGLACIVTAPAGTGVCPGEVSRVCSGAEGDRDSYAGDPTRPAPVTWQEFRKGGHLRGGKIKSSGWKMRNLQIQEFEGVNPTAQIKRGARCLAPRKYSEIRSIWPIVENLMGGGALHHVALFRAVSLLSWASSHLSPK